MDSPYNKEIEVAIVAIQQAAKISRAVISRQDKGTTEKDDLSLVTVADFAVQALLTATIHATFPEDRFVGEESAAELRNNQALLSRVWHLLTTLREDDPTAIIPKDEEQMCEMIDWCGNGIPGPGRMWVMDPIDGTQTFVRGEMYAINVALLQDGKHVAGIVGLPLLAVDAKAPVTNDTLDPSGRGTILLAAKGHGTYIRPLVGLSSEVELRKVPHHADDCSLDDLRSVSCYNMLASGVDPIHETIVESYSITFPGCDLLGWVPRWSVLAMGLANMTVWVYKKRTRYGKIWDHAGAMLCFEEVGGKITDIDGKDIDLSVGRTMSSNHGFVAAPSNLHASVLATVHRILEAEGKSDLLAVPSSQ